MSKDKDDDFDDDLGDNDDDQIPQNNNNAANSNKPNSFNFAKDFNPAGGMDLNEMGSFGGGGLGGMGGMGGMGGFGGFGGAGMGLGGGFGGFGGFGGGGFGKFGGGMFGGHGDHGHNNEIFGDSIMGVGSKKKNDEQKQQPQEKKEPQQPEQTEQQRLARLTKKKDIPEDQQITIVDWAIRGPAEIIRMVLQYILIPYKQRKYVFVTKDQWFKQDRPRLQADHPGLQLPYIQDGSKIIYGTEAIIIYILHKYQRTQLLGVTPVEKVRIATVSSIYWEFMQDYYELVYGEYDESLNWEKAQQRYVNQKFRVSMFRMVTFLKQTHHNLSSDFNWMDLAIAEMVSVLNVMDKRFKEFNSHVQNYANRVFALPQFIVYKRSERFHQRPYNGLGSIWK